MYRHTAYAQQPSSTELQLQQKVQVLDWRVTQLDKRIQDAAESGLVLFLCGVFCALWAQNTGRSAWLWFFLGIFFHVITLIILLIKNSKQPPNRFNIGDYRQQ